MIGSNIPGWMTNVEMEGDFDYSDRFSLGALGAIVQQLLFEIQATADNFPICYQSPGAMKALSDQVGKLDLFMFIHAAGCAFVPLPAARTRCRQVLSSFQTLHGPPSQWEQEVGELYITYASFVLQTSIIEKSKRSTPFRRFRVFYRFSCFPWSIDWPCVTQVSSHGPSVG